MSEEIEKMLFLERARIAKEKAERDAKFIELDYVDYAGSRKVHFMYWLGGPHGACGEIDVRNSLPCRHSIGYMVAGFHVYKKGDKRPSREKTLRQKMNEFFKQLFNWP